MSDLIDFGSVKRARLGVAMTPVDEKTAAELKLSAPEGVYINEVSKGSAAEKAGVKEGDVVVAIDSTVIKTPAGLQEKVNSFHPGDKAEITVIRSGKTLRLPVTFQGTMEETGTVAEDGSVAFYGGRIRPASRETLAQLGLKRGVEVVSAGNGKLASAGATDGFIILYVNDQPVSNPQDVLDQAKKSRRAIFVEGVSAVGKPGYFGFAKDEK